MAMYSIHRPICARVIAINIMRDFDRDIIYKPSLYFVIQSVVKNE